MSKWITVGKLSDIPVQGARVIQANGHEIAVFRTANDSLFALHDRCPHKGGPLSEGIVYGERVACPLHNWSIDLATGEAVAPDRGCAHSYAVRCEGDEVQIAVQE